MLDAMRQIALDAIFFELADPAENVPEEWYELLRKTDPGRLFPKLVEETERIELYYSLQPDANDSSVAILAVHEFKPGDGDRLPFNQASGPQSPALGPLIKRTWKAKAKEAGPSLKIQKTTLDAFQEIAAEGKPWSGYFGRARECWQRPNLQVEMTGAKVSSPGGALRKAVETITEKKTVFLAYQEKDGRFPGQVPEYKAYLQEVLARTKYATSAIAARPGQTCALCGTPSVTVYPNALRGAGINLANLDREGAFPGIDASASWKGYALCGDCADLLYIYKYHVSSDFYVSVAGDRALVIPFTQLDAHLRRDFISKARKLVDGIAKDELRARENGLLRLLGEHKAITELTFLWAEFGQKIDDIRGIVTDILPSRLRRIDEVNREVTQITSPLFPEWHLEEFDYDLRLSVLRPLLLRPGGKKTKSINASKRLFDLKRDLAAAIYHGSERLPRHFWQDHLSRRFWDEVMITARCQLDEARDKTDGWGLLYEGHSEKKNTSFLTAAGWVRQLAKFFHYLTLTGVIPVPGNCYQPKAEVLKPYFVQESGIDSPAKAFAFILGTLFGKVMQVQGGRGVNVGANALTWLKRLTLTGRDLPELYVKVREKLLAYETEGSPIVREIVTELGDLGTTLGNNIHLDDTTTCYFLLLGQSLATRIIPRKPKASPKELKDEHKRTNPDLTS